MWYVRFPVSFLKGRSGYSPKTRVLPVPACQSIWTEGVKETFSELFSFPGCEAQPGNNYQGSEGADLWTLVVLESECVGLLI